MALEEERLSECEVSLNGTACSARNGLHCNVDSNGAVAACNVGECFGDNCVFGRRIDVATIEECLSFFKCYVNGACSRYASLVKHVECESNDTIAPCCISISKCFNNNGITCFRRRNLLALEEERLSECEVSLNGTACSARSGFHCYVNSNGAVAACNVGECLNDSGVFSRRIDVATIEEGLTLFKGYIDDLFRLAIGSGFHCDVYIYRAVAARNIGKCLGDSSVFSRSVSITSVEERFAFVQSNIYF